MRAMARGDLAFAAKLQMRYLNHGLFPALGNGFLQRYLGTFISSPYAVALVVERNGSPAGFLVGTLRDREHYRYVIRQCGVSLALRGIPALLVQPAVAWRFLRTRALRYIRGVVRLGRTRTSGGQPSSKEDAVLSHMAVLPTARGLGVGKRLVRAFCDEVRRSGVPGVRLTTRTNAAGASGFYERLGWCYVSEFVDQDGLAWTRLRLDLGGS